MQTQDWTEAYEQLEAPLYNVVFRWLWHEEDARDVVQEAFLRAWKKRADIHADGFRPLLFRIALNLASNRRRQRRVWSMVTLEHWRQPIEDSTEQAAIDAGIRHAITSLSDAHRTVLMLTEYAGMDYTEIAAVMKVRPGTVASRRHRALAALKAALRVKGLDYEDD